MWRIGIDDDEMWRWIGGAAHVWFAFRSGRGRGGWMVWAVRGLGVCVLCGGPGAVADCRVSSWVGRSGTTMRADFFFLVFRAHLAADGCTAWRIDGDEMWAWISDATYLWSVCAGFRSDAGMDVWPSVQCGAVYTRWAHRRCIVRLALDLSVLKTILPRVIFFLSPTDALISRLHRASRRLLRLLVVAFG
ncbi:hypothetical protein B0H19DRAFT_1252065 [Mycena capillaripes]|nr:hypothetical protein B0H19DRAFT_1252065 [Mycena capillaripes]